VASATRTATVTASANAVSRTATLTVNGSGATVGTVTISRADWNGGRLRIEATGSPAGTLTAYVTSTNTLIGTISGGRLEVNMASNPGNVTVRSTNGGQASRAVSG
jgi:hypothetical protein